MLKMKKLRKTIPYSGRCVCIEYHSKDNRSYGTMVIESNYYVKNTKKINRVLKGCDIISFYERQIVEEDNIHVY